MNFFIQNLILSKSFNIFLTISKYNENYIINNCKFNFFLNFIIYIKFLNFLKISKTNFNNNIFNCLFIDKLDYINNQTYQNLKNIQYNSNISMINCIFKNCYNITNVGAIYFSNIVQEVNIYSCVFDHCFSIYGIGGAINSKSNQLIMKYSCFSSCWATSTNPISWGGSGVFFGNNLNIYLSSTYNITTRDGSFTILSSNSIVSNYNSSYSNAIGTAGLQNSVSNSFYCKFCQFEKSICNSVISFWSTGSNYLCEYLNIFNNEITNTAYSALIRTMIEPIIYIKFVQIYGNIYKNISSGTGTINLLNYNLSSSTYYFSLINTWNCKGNFNIPKLFTYNLQKKKKIIYIIFILI